MTIESDGHLLKLQPLVKLSELDDSVCNRIRPLNVYLCEVFQISPHNYQLSWHVKINGTISRDIIFLKHNGTGYSLQNETISGFELTSTLLEHNKTHCTEPILISTLNVHPPTNNINAQNFLSVSCEFDHIILSVKDPINVTVDGITHRDLTGMSFI